LPGIPGEVLPRGLDLSRTERKAPLRLRASLHEELEIRLVLPGEADVLLLPEEVDRTGGQGIALKVSCSREANAIRVARTLSIPEASIAPVSWPGLRDLLVRRSRVEGMGLTWRAREARP
jgi:hypothetical protein